MSSSISSFSKDMPMPRGERELAFADPMSAGEDSDDSGLDISQIWRIIKRHIWGILSVIVIALLIGLINALRAVPIYSAQAKLLVEPNQPNVAPMQAVTYAPNAYLFYETQHDIIKSRAVAERIVEKLGLVAPETIAAAMRRSEVREEADILDWRDWLPEEWRPPAPPRPTPESIRTGVVSALSSGLKVTGGTESQIIHIGFEWSDPAYAVRVVNAAADAYIEFGMESRLTTSKQTASWLGGRVVELRKRVSEAEAKLSTYQAEEGVLGKTNRESVVSAKLASLTAELIKAQSRRGEAEARYQELEKAMGSGKLRDDISNLLVDPLLASLESERHRLSRRIVELDERYGHKHPKMISARAELREIDRKIKLVIRKAVEGVRKEFQIAKTQEDELRRIIAEQQTQMRALSSKVFKVEKLEREVESSRQLYETFLNRFKEVDIVEDFDAGNVRIIDRAEPNFTPIRPNKKRMVMVSVLFGLVIGVLLAYLRERLDNTFKTREDVESRLHLPMLGLLPVVKVLRKHTYQVEQFVLNEPRSPFAEGINDIRTGVLFTNIDSPPKIILVTSSVEAEGKTTLASNLATIFAQRGRTLLVDTDLRRAGLSRTYELQKAPGLTDVLADKASLEESLLHDESVEGLSVLGSGTLPPNPLEIISSQRFQELFAQFRDEYDHIVVDGSPVLPVSDSVIVAHMADAVLMAVRAEKTPYPLAQDALKRLMAANVKPTGVVLSRVNMKRLHSYSGRYGHYYGAYYGSGTMPTVVSRTE